MYFCVIYVLYVFLQYFDTVGWVFWPVKTVARITYTVLADTLNPAQYNQSMSNSLTRNPLLIINNHTVQTQMKQYMPSRTVSEKISKSTLVDD